MGPRKLASGYHYTRTGVSAIRSGETYQAPYFRLTFMTALLGINKLERAKGIEPS